MTEAVERATSGKDELAGTLRISTTVDHASLSLAPALAQFARQHLRLAIDLRTSDRVVDLIEAGINVSIRLGWLRGSSNRAVKLGEFEQCVVASPAFRQQVAVPARPEELESLDWVAWTLMRTPLTWEFSSRSGETRTIHVKSRVRVDSPGVLRSLIQDRKRCLGERHH